MGCGSPLGDLFYLADSLLQRESGNGWPSEVAGFSPRNMLPESLRPQLYQMYGEGQISEEVFNALRMLADRGQLHHADLAVHRPRAQHDLAGHDDPAATNALRGIRARLAQLAQARNTSEQVLADLDTQLLDIDQRMVDKEQAARDAVAVERDEESARKRLAEKAELALGHDRLAAQAQALRSDLSRLEDLRAQLEARSIELEALQVRSRLNEEMLK